MSYSTTQVKCSHCQEKYLAALKGELFKVDEEYAALCPNCNNETFIRNITGIVVDSIPTDSVNIIHVKQINKR